MMVVSLKRNDRLSCTFHRYELVDETELGRPRTGTAVQQCRCQGIGSALDGHNGCRACGSRANRALECGRANSDSGGNQADAPQPGAPTPGRRPFKHVADRLLEGPANAL